MTSKNNTTSKATPPALESRRENTMSTRFATAALGAILAVGTANAATFSFAADNDPTEPTLLSQFDNAFNVTRITDVGPTMTVLFVDPQNGGAVASFNAMLTVNFEMAYLFSTEAGPGVFSHLFSLVGEFEFRDANTDEFLLKGTVDKAEAAMAALGSATTVMSGFITGFDISYEVGSLVAAVAGFGGFVPGDFGFTLTAINHGQGADLVMDGNQIMGIEPFEARASFSGSIIPSPGAAGLLACAGVLAFRRRR